MRLICALLLVLSFDASRPCLAQTALPPDPARNASLSDSAASPIRIRGNAKIPRLLLQVAPLYPPLARQTRTSGIVRLHLVIAGDGSVREAAVVSGHPLLQQAAIDAVRKWRYEPTSVEGKPVEVEKQVDVVFEIEGQSVPAPLAPPPVDPAIKSAVLRLFSVMNFKENAARTAQVAMDELRPALAASLPATVNRQAILDAYTAQLAALLQSDDYLDRAAEIYANYFSEEDIRALTDFYSSPAGQRLSASMPGLNADLNALGQRLANRALPGILAQLCSDFPDLSRDPNFCRPNNSSSAPPPMPARDQP